MKITRIRRCKTGLPYVDDSYARGAGSAIPVAKASVAVIDTDAGLQDCGEFTPCGTNDMVAHSKGGEGLARQVVHFAVSTSGEYLINPTDLTNRNTRSAGLGGPATANGKLCATHTPGLGVAPDFNGLGAQVATWGEAT